VEKASAKSEGNTVEITLPATAPNTYASVIKLVVNGKVEEATAK
jgi:hypothetical protein